MPRNVVLHLVPGDRDEPPSVLAEARYWDAVVLGEPLPADPVDPDLAATIQRILTLDDAPLPDAGFAARLEHELLRSGVPTPHAPAWVPSTTLGPVPDTASTRASRPNGPRRRLLINLMEIAALVAIVLTSVLVTLRVGPLTSRDRGVTPLVLGPGITDETLLVHAQFERFPDGILTVSIERWVLQPGAEMPMGSHESGGEGPSAYVVESGTLTLRADGPIALTRAGSTTAASIAAGSPTTLHPGDRGLAPSGITSLWRNEGTVPVRILEAKVKRNDVSARGDGVLNYTVVSESPFVRPDHPITVTVVQVTLHPGAELVADAVPGLEMMKVEAGRLVAVDVDGAGNPLPPVVVGEATRLHRSFLPGRVFRSGNDEPVSLLLVTIGDANPLGVGR